MSDRTCSVEGCEKPVQSRGWCATHYRRWYDTGDVNAAVPIKPRRTTCNVEDCDRPHYGFGYCRMHYRRWRGTGAPGPAESLRRPDRGCMVDGCDDKHKAKGYCQIHFDRWYKHGDPLLVLPPNGGSLKADENPNWQGTRITYIAAHQRVIRLNGPAADHTCRHCGAKAAHWAYDHGDPEALTDERGYPYSTDPSHYMPLCGSCHKRFDLHLEAANGQHLRGASPSR